MHVDFILNYVTDNQRPVFDECPSAPLIADVTPDASSNGTVVEFDIHVQDNTGPSNLNIQTIPLQSGDVFPYGRTVVMVNATDTAGNFAICNFNIIVRGEFKLLPFLHFETILKE